MTRDDIVSKVKQLNLAIGSYIVFGSCPMAAAGIREAQDIDLLVSTDVFTKLKSQGWAELDKGKKDKPLVSGIFEVHNRWDFSSYKPTLEHLLTSAELIDGVPFASLQEVRKWKFASARPKDLADIKLIDNYLKKSEHKASTDLEE